MQTYHRNKPKTAWDMMRRIKNWPAAFDLRLRPNHVGFKLLSFRDGLEVMCRGKTRDWDVVHELLFAEGYSRAFSHLKSLPGKPVVLDLGGNIGLFSLKAASINRNAEVYAYEPGPPNFRMFEINSLLNPVLSERIHLRKEAVSGTTTITEWHFNAENPGGSSLFSSEGSAFQVQMRSLEDVVNSIQSNVALAKIDIEGAEFEMLEKTPPEIWKKVQAISLELHDDPQGRISQKEFLGRMKSFGFEIEEETVCSYFLHR